MIPNSVARPFLVLILFFLLSPCILREVRAVDTAIEVEPQQSSAQTGETFNITIKVVNVQNLYGVGIFLKWNSSVLKATKSYVRFGVEDYPDGILHKPIMPLADKINQTAGIYSVAVASLVQAGSFNGTGTVAILTFNVTAVGASELKIDSEQTELAGLVNGQATLIEYTAVNSLFSSSTIIEVQPENISSQVGGTFNVSIKIVRVQGLYGIDVRLRWNPSILNAISGQDMLGVEDYPDGILHKEIFRVKDNVINQTAGTYWIAAASIPPAASFNGSGTVAVITFSVVKDGNSTLSIDLNQTVLATPVISGQSTSIKYTAFDSFFSSEPQQTGAFDWSSILIPLAIALTILILAIALIYAMRRRKLGRYVGSSKSRKLIRMQGAVAMRSSTAWNNAF